MSNAADRAEARRRAILAKRGDRLAKLTTTARGDEGKTYLSDDASSFSKAFLGEDMVSDMPTPPRASVSPSPIPTPRSTVTSSSTAPSSIPTSSVKPETLFNGVDESVWSPELQEQFRQALLSANAPRSRPSSRVPSGASASSPDPGTEQLETDPLAELLASLGGGAAGTGQPTGPNMLNLLQTMRNGSQAFAPDAQPPKRDKAIRSLIQLISAWLLLAYFVFFLEPAAYKQHVGSLDVGRWSRWAVLGENRSMLELLSTFKVQPQPAFFWAFVALQVAIHFNSIRNTLVPSVRIPSLLDAFGPLAKIPSLFNLGLLFLNGLGGITFGLGFTIFLAGYASAK